MKRFRYPVWTKINGPGLIIFCTMADIVMMFLSIIQGNAVLFFITFSGMLFLVSILVEIILEYSDLIINDVGIIRSFLGLKLCVVPWNSVRDVAVKTVLNSPLRPGGQRICIVSFYARHRFLKETKFDDYMESFCDAANEIARKAGLPLRKSISS